MTLLLGNVKFSPKQKRHPDRSVAKWRELLFLSPIGGLDL
jgi:hypothetical protein